MERSREKGTGEIGTMKLVERHIIRAGHKHYSEIDDFALRAKNLYNRANYILRQHFGKTGKIFSMPKMDNIMQPEESYKALPAKVSQQVLRMLDRNWKSWVEALKAYQEDPSKFLGRPRIPKYKDKAKGGFALVYTIQALGQKALKKGLIAPSRTGIAVPTKKSGKIQEVRIIPGIDYYVIEVVCEREPENLNLNHSHGASIDTGLNNLATVTSNVKGFSPVLINGRPLKSINQFYNKQKAKLQTLLKGDKRTSVRIQRLSTKRNFKVDDYLHKASRLVINHLVKHNIGTLIIGKNDLWKQSSNMGKRHNQNFVAIPDARFIQMLTYKAALVGIQIILTEESYTSKASFLDNDPIPTYGESSDPLPKFSGVRVKRGLYKSAGGRKLNADVNESFNMHAKSSPQYVRNRSRASGVPVGWG